MTMSCAEAVHRLWAYLDRHLGQADRRRVEEHLAWCRRCCGELEFAARLQEMLASAAGPDLPPEIEARLEGFLDTMVADPAAAQGVSGDPSTD